MMVFAALLHNKRDTAFMGQQLQALSRWFSELDVSLAQNRLILVRPPASASRVPCPASRIAARRGPPF